MLGVRHRGTHTLVEVTPSDDSWTQLRTIVDQSDFWSWSDVEGDWRQKDGWRSILEVRWHDRQHIVNLRIRGRTPDVLRVEPGMNALVSWMDRHAGFDYERWWAEQEANEPTEPSA
jgi:hypothetical protein